MERLTDDEAVSTGLCGPVTEVAEGALFDREIEDDLKVTSMYALGTTHQPGGRNSKMVFIPLIKAGSVLPASPDEKSYTPNDEIVGEVSIPIWVADPDRPLHDPENFQLTTVKAQFPKRLAGQDAEFLLKYT